jgi:DNA-binding Xre family transcriptional regulator
MAISDKLRALMALNGKKSADLAAYYGITPQAMRNKFSRGSFSADDLIKLSTFLGAELLFRSVDGQVITLDERDLQSAATKDEGSDG